jgi:hypothetical protein
MRGTDERSGPLFSYVDLEARVRSDHPSLALSLCTPFTSIHFWDGRGGCGCPSDSAASGCLCLVERGGSEWQLQYSASIRGCKPAQIRWPPILGAVQPKWDGSRRSCTFSGWVPHRPSCVRPGYGHMRGRFDMQSAKHFQTDRLGEALS